MTIKVSKPSINLREKLNELDFDRVPFQKMPVGSVVQVVSESFTTRIASSSSSFVATDISASISPTSANSKIAVFISASGNTNNTDGTDMYYTLVVNNLTNLGHINYGFGAIRSTHRTETPIVVNYVDSPSSTESVTYSLYFRSEVSGKTVEVPQLAGQVCTIILMEIAQ